MEIAYDWNTVHYDKAEMIIYYDLIQADGCLKAIFDLDIVAQGSRGTNDTGRTVACRDKSN